MNNCQSMLGLFITDQIDTQQKIAELYKLQGSQRIYFNLYRFNSSKFYFDRKINST